MMSAAAFLEPILYQPAGHGPILLAAELEDPSSSTKAMRIWTARGGLLQALSHEGAVVISRNFPFEIKHLQTAYGSVIVAGEDQLEILDLTGSTQCAHGYAVRQLNADRFCIAFCVKNHSDEIYLHKTSTNLVHQVVAAEESVSCIALRDTLLAAAHPDSNEVSIWRNVNSSVEGSEVPVLCYKIAVEPHVEKIFFAPEFDRIRTAVWRSDDQVVVWYSGDCWVNTVPANFCSFNRHAICSGSATADKTEIHLDWADASNMVVLPGNFTAAAATPDLLALLSVDGRIELRSVAPAPSECTIL